jgi:spermidine synthase
MLVLLPASLALGATLPAMEAVIQRCVPTGSWVGSLYGSQTLGAVVGVLGGGLGLQAIGGEALALGVFASANGLCALGALWVGRRLRDNRGPDAADHSALGRESDPRIRRLLGLLGVTGFLGLGYEVLAVRVLRELLEGTVYTYGIILAVYLVGSAVGAGVQGRRRGSIATLLGGLAAVCWFGWWMACWAPDCYAMIRAGLGDSLVATVAAEALVAAGVLLVPSCLMGWTFAELAQRARDRSGHLGLAVAVNTLGAALAPPLFGVALVPVIGFGWAGSFVVTGYLVLALLVVVWGDAPVKERRWAMRRSRSLVLLATGFGVAAIVRPEPGGLDGLPRGSRVVAERRGVAETVRVIEDEAGERTLRVGRHLNMGGTAATRRERLQAFVPLRLHPAPRRALFLGGGTGITLGSCLSYPDLQATGVELLPEAVGLAGWFDSANGFQSWPPRVRLITADARRFVQTTPERYDVIVGDLFHPGRDGVAALFTREHFAAVRDRLAEQGVFLQWLPLHQLQGRALKSVVRTFLEVFPQAEGWWLDWDVQAPVLGLLGSREGRLTPVTWLEKGPLLAEVTQDAMTEVGLKRTRSLLFRLAADATLLRRWAAGAPLNTDARPVLTFLAPRRTVRMTVEPSAPLRELLALPVPSPESVLLHLNSVEGAALGSRIGRAWQARNRYLQGLIAEADGRPGEALSLWLESAALSDDFTLGYAKCLSLAVAWASGRPSDSQELLRRLEQARPERSVAAEVRRRLFPEAGAAAAIGSE